jgi:hypothetical protein
MRLPVVRSGRGLFLAAVATIVACAAMYYIPQHWRLTGPRHLPMTALDRAMPFWPASGLVYFAVFPFLLGTFLLLQDRARATRFLFASLFAQAIGMASFLLWPITYPRELYPLPATAGALGAALVGFCRSMDAPVNCLPSLHVSTVVQCIGALRGTRYFPAALAAGIPLSLSTLTFKQHYAADVLAGLALGLLACALFLPRAGQRGTA